MITDFVLQRNTCLSKFFECDFYLSQNHRGGPLFLEDRFCFVSIQFVDVWTDVVYQSGRTMQGFIDRLGPISAHLLMNL